MKKLLVLQVKERADKSEVIRGSHTWLPFYETVHGQFFEATETETGSIKLFDERLEYFDAQDILNGYLVYESINIYKNSKGELFIDLRDVGFELSPKVKIRWRMQEVLIVTKATDLNDAEGYLEGRHFDVDAILLPEDEWDFTFTDGRSISFEHNGVVYTNFGKRVDVIDWYPAECYTYEDNLDGNIFIRLEVIEGGLDCEEWESLQK